MTGERTSARRNRSIALRTAGTLLVAAAALTACGRPQLPSVPVRPSASNVPPLPSGTFQTPSLTLEAPKMAGSCTATTKEAVCTAYESGEFALERPDGSLYAVHTAKKSDSFILALGGYSTLDCRVVPIVYVDPADPSIKERIGGINKCQAGLLEPLPLPTR